MKAEKVMCDTRKDKVEKALFGDLSDQDLEFVANILESTLEGKPNIGYCASDNTWSVMPTCECDSCKPFVDNFAVISCNTLIRAIRRYIEQYASYYQLVEAPTTTTKH